MGIYLWKSMFTWGTIPKNGITLNFSIRIHQFDNFRIIEIFMVTLLKLPGWKSGWYFLPSSVSLGLHIRLQYTAYFVKQKESSICFLSQNETDGLAR